MQQFTCASDLRPTRLPLRAWLGAMLRRLLIAYRRRRIITVTLSTLHGLDDRTLKDIGLDRSEIESVIGKDLTERWPPRFEFRL